MTSLYITKEQLQSFLREKFLPDTTSRYITERMVFDQYLRVNYPQITSWPKYKFVLIQESKYQTLYYRNNFELIFEAFDNLEDEVLFRLQI